MFRSYLLIAFRNLIHQRFYTFLNILGLAIGLSGFILLTLWLKEELNYDNYLPNADRIYRLETSLVTHGVPQPMAATDPRITNRIWRDYSDIADVTRLYRVSSLLSADDQRLYEDNTYYADSTFFNVFAFHFLAGDPSTALLSRGSIVINQRTAQKLFGDQNALGRTVYVNNSRTKAQSDTFTITGVIQNEGQPSHFHPQVIIAKFRRMETFELTYILFKKGYDVDQFNEVWKQMYADFFRQDYQKDDQDIYFNRLQPLRQIHLGGNKWEDVEKNGDVTFIYVFSAIAILLLIVACINYVNLATARSFNRAREVGVRKVLGATRRQLMKQFLTESVVLSLLALLLALCFTEIILPYFNSLADKQLVLALDDPGFIAELTLLAVVIGFVSGLYPASSIVSFQPIKSLQGHVTPSTRKPTLRKMLVVLQFSISIIMLIGILVITRQLNYVKNKDLGFDTDRMLLVTLNDQKVNAERETFKDSVLINPNVLRVSAAYNVPGTETNHTYLNFETDKGNVPKLTTSMYVDHDYVNVMGLKLLKGRNFDSSMLQHLDSTAYIIANESAAKMLGTDNPVGIKVETGYTYGLRKGHIIGMVKDFNATSLRDTIGPLFLILGTIGRPEGKNNFLSIKVKADGLESTIQYVKSVYEHFGQGSPFKYTFLDEAFNQQYQKEEKQKILFNWFAGLSIFISCLGLAGLTAFYMQQRAREIAIRKISGARIGDIVLLLSRDFIKLVFMAMAIATPLAYYIMQHWLSKFAYHIIVDWTVFAIAIGVILLLVTITVYIQLLFTFYKNPASILRYE